MKTGFLILFFQAFVLSVFVHAAPGGGGGDVVGNGGGLSEQSLLYVSLHYRSFAGRCLQNSACSSSLELATALKKVQSCPVPQVQDFKFQTPQENTSLKGRIYSKNSDTAFVVNREELYKPHALRFPTAMAFLARVYFDFCGAISWNQSAAVVSPLVKMAEYDGEQITVGKDSIRLPQEKWIRVRSLFSDLLIETPTEMLSLSCRRQNIEDCGVMIPSQEVAAADRFRYLSLADEEILNGQVIFTVEGHYQPAEKKNEFFDLKVTTENGKILKIQWLGKVLPLPVPQE